MIRKNVPIKFKNPASSMFLVYQAVLHGANNQQTIVEKTHLSHTKVKSALWNLSFTGMIKHTKEGGRTRYTVNDGKTVVKVSVVWSNANSVFSINL